MLSVLHGMFAMQLIGHTAHKFHGVGRMSVKILHTYSYTCARVSYIRSGGMCMCAVVSRAERSFLIMSTIILKIKRVVDM